MPTLLTTSRFINKTDILDLPVNSGKNLIKLFQSETEEFVKFTTKVLPTNSCILVFRSNMMNRWPPSTQAHCKSGPSLYLLLAQDKENSEKSLLAAYGGFHQLEQ